MANGRHSFVAFYPSDWLGGTARLPRLHRSVFFDVCCYVWDTAKRVPERELRLMIADLPNGPEIVEDLLAMGKLDRADDGTISNAKALYEAEKAQAAWERMSQGGRQARSKDDAMGDGKGDGKGDAMVYPSTIPQNQNQNQNQIKPNGLSHRVSDADIERVFGVWNAMAAENDLAKAVKLTDKRRAAIRARLKDFDVGTICLAIDSVPQSRFLTGGGERGWKADFDFILQPSSLTKLIEGAYHRGGNGKPSGWMGVIRGN